MFERFNPFAKKESGEPVGGVVHEISTPQEEEGHFTYENVKFGIKKAYIGLKAEDRFFRAEDMMDRWEEFEEKLVEEGVITAKDQSFEGTHDIVKKATRDVAREILAEEDAARSKNKMPGSTMRDEIDRSA